MVTPTKKENFTRISIAYNVGILWNYYRSH
jgi:hypothetical protein